MDRTAPRARARMPVRRLGARVVGGPDLGAEVSGEDALSIGTAEGNDLVLSDPTVSRYHLEIRRSTRGVEVEDRGSTNGIRIGGSMLLRGAVPPGARLELGATVIEVLDQGLAELDLFRELPDLVVVAPITRLTLARVERAAQSDVPVLLAGESGTGKERFAEALHRLGPRASLPFVVVDCGAVPASLLASELFGHERGAFTGAQQAREGALERARGGTIFLDEIAELDADAAQLLSGVMARRTFRRVGGTQEISLEARVVSASHADLFRLANEGRFRSDLLHRLMPIRITVPPLRERPEEIEALVLHFLRAAGHRGPRAEVISDADLESFVAHPWPGNVRELRQAVLAQLATGEPAELSPSPPTGPFADVLALPFRAARDRAMGAFEERYLRRLLERTRENVSEAARVSGVDRTHLHDLLKRHALR